MGGLGSAMKTRLLRAMTVAACWVLIHAATGISGGITFGVPICTLALSGPLDRVSIAAWDAYAAVEAALIDLGLSADDLDEIRARIGESIQQVDDVASTVPPLVPIPLIGGTIEVSLPLIIIDAIRFTGGLLNDGLLRSALGLAGIEIPAPLLEMTFDGGGDSAGATIDVAFSSWLLSTDVVKRFDLVVLAVTIGAGVDLARGEIRPLVDIEVPTEFEGAVGDALTALHLDGMSWSTFAVHGVVGLEIGPPFLRLYGDVRFLLPVSVGGGWWDLRAGGLAAVLGVVIRF